jgi:hypothetical protein
VTPPAWVDAVVGGWDGRLAADAGEQPVYDDEEDEAD